MEVKLYKGEFDRVEILLDPDTPSIHYAPTNEDLAEIKEQIKNGYICGWISQNEQKQYAWWQLKDKINPSFAVLARKNHQPDVQTDVHLISDNFLRSHQDTFWLSPEDFVIELKVGNISTETHYFNVIYDKR